MEDDQARPPEPTEPDSTDDVVEKTRMSFGQHLEELRSCLIRGLAGVVLATIVALIFGKRILEILCLPLLFVQHVNGLPPHLQVLAPTAAFVAYLKIGILSGLILAMPWLLYQMWHFVATGLYKHERRFVQALIPVSVTLFVVGVLFLYFIVLPLVLQFFVTFNKAFGTPELSPTVFQKLLMPEEEAPEPTVELPDPVRIPLVREEPTDPKPGDVWVNQEWHRLVVQTAEGPMSMALEPGTRKNTMDSQFAIDFYVSFVLMLALAFGIAFETPVVVFFLAWSGIVPTAAMARSRRYVLLAAVIAAAMLTPPDVISQVLLAGPMFLLFELGILVARVAERNKKP
ncbi:MAG: twin-arginine translocase subunit TatC [Phycisphaerae bacterium]|jgi:sec-independent protein translocase protein TatC